MRKVLLEVKDGDKVLKSQDIEISDLNFTDRLEYNDLMLEHFNNPSSGVFKRVGKVLKLCTNMNDESLNRFTDPELLQVFSLIADEYSKKK